MKVFLETEINIPVRKNRNDVGYDLQAYLETESIVIKAGERKLIHTGLKMDIPIGYELQIRTRSGLALKRGLTVLNSPGTVDPGYKDDIGVILLNTSNDDTTIFNGDRIAQAVLNKFETIEFELVENIDKTDDRKGGFGSTGINDGL